MVLVLLISVNIWGSRPENLEKIDAEQLGISVYFSSSPFLEKAKRTLAILQDAFARQVVQQGFTAPLGYQIYLSTTATGGAYTKRDALGIYSVIDPALSASLWETYIHHEWQHACQYAMGGPSSSLWMDEASAVLQEIIATPLSPYWLEGLKDFQGYPQAPLFSSEKYSTNYVYGGALFLLFLEEKYGAKDGQLVRRLWQKGEPWKTTLEEVTKSSLPNLVLDFALWRIRAGASYGAPGILKTRRLLKISDGPLLIHQEEMPYQLGCFFIQHSVKNNPILLQISVKSLLPKPSERPLAIAWQIIKKNQTFENNNNLTVYLQEEEEITIAICDLSEHLAFEKPEVHPIEVFLQRL